LTPPQNTVIAAADKETTMLRDSVNMADSFNPALCGGMVLPVSNFSKTTAKTTTKTV
jgi:hypothetical protein